MKKFDRASGQFAKRLTAGALLALSLVGAAASPRLADAAEGKFKPSAKHTSEKKAVKENFLMIAGLQSTIDINFEPCTQPSIENCIKVANGGLFSAPPVYATGKRQIVFMPSKKGETTVTIRDEKGDIRLILKVVISDNNLERKLGELKLLLRDIEGIDLKIMGDRIVIDGEVVVLNDLNRLYTVVSDSTYKDQVLLLVGVSPVGMQIMAERIQAEINKPNVKVRPFNGLFLVEGQVDSADEARAVLDIARSMLSGFALPKINPGAVELKGPIDVKTASVKDPIIARLTFAPPKPKAADKMIRVTIDFVELSKDYLRNFGFQWIPTIDNGGSVSFGESSTGGLTSSSGSSSLSGTIANLFPRLQTAQNAGYARVLEESIMLVRSGGNANFNRKLDVPIQTVNAQGQPNFTKQSVGPEIDLKPRVIGSSEDIELDIDFKYDGLAGKTSQALITLGHKYKTSVIVKSGESAALVNAMSNVISTAFNKDPVQAVNGNPLFTLLRSKAFQKNKSQFVVFLTPQIISSSSEGTEDIKSKYGLKKKQQ